MGNLWIAMIPTFFVCVVGVCVIIHEIVHKGDFYFLKSVAFACIIIAMFLFYIPHMKDIVGQKTTVVTAEYIDYQDGNTAPCTLKVFFMINNRQIELIVPTFTRDVAKLEPGEIYEIEYFNNSKVIKSYKLVE